MIVSRKLQLVPLRNTLTLTHDDDDDDNGRDVYRIYSLGCVLTARGGLIFTGMKISGHSNQYKNHSTKKGISS